MLIPDGCVFKEERTAHRTLDTITARIRCGELRCEGIVFTAREERVAVRLDVGEASCRQCTMSITCVGTAGASDHECENEKADVLHMDESSVRARIECWDCS